MKRTSFLRLAGLLLACLALLVVTRFGSDHIDPAAPPAASAAEQPGAPDTSLDPGESSVDIPPEAPIANDRRARAQRTQSRALQQPAPGTSVLAVVDALDARARAGDDLAACRLAVELLTCVPFNLNRESRLQAVRERLLAGQHPGRDLAQDLASLDRIAERNAQRVHSCEGVDASVIRQAPRYALMGALRGNPTAVALFLSADQVTPGMLVADPDLAAAYRQHGWPMLRAMIESGHPTSVFLWEAALPPRGSAATHAVTFSPLAEMIPPEWRRPEVVRALQRRVQLAMGLPEPGGPRGSMDPTANAEAEDLFQRHFAHSPWMRLMNTIDEELESPLRGLDLEKHYQRQLDYCDPERGP